MPLIFLHVLHSFMLFQFRLLETVMKTGSRPGTRPTSSRARNLGHGRRDEVAIQAPRIGDQDPVGRTLGSIRDALDPCPVGAELPRLAVVREAGVEERS